MRETMSDDVETTAPKLPKFLDIHTACTTSLDGLSNEEWGMFSDNEGRIIAQRVNLIFNESDCKSTRVPEDHTSDGKEPSLVLVVATDSREELPPPSTEMPEEMFSSDLETTYCRTKTWVEKQEDISESILSRQNLEYTLSYHDESSNNFNPSHIQKSDISAFGNDSVENYPCIRKEWYIRKPLDTSEIVDDISIIDTQVLANDVRKFLNHHLIPLGTFAKLHLNRTQGTLSDLLNHTKPWDLLSNKGKEVYVKLIKFLSSDDLPFHILQLRKKYPNNKNEHDRLPVSILNKLSANLMPSDQDISAAATYLHLNVDYIKKHCVEQLKRNRQDSQTEFYTGFTPDEGICGTKFLGCQICTYFGCGLILPNKSSFNLHLRNHSEGNLYQCLVCSRSFATKSNLNSHFKTHTRSTELCSRAKGRLMTEMKKYTEVEQVYSEEEHSLDGMKYICGMCWKGFKSRQQLTKHLSSEHCIGQRNLRRGLTCYVCSKVLKNISALDVHMRTHTNSRPYECNQCKMRFQTKANLQRHIRIHTGEKPYACTCCPARFTEAKSVAVHMRTHTGEKPFQCTICQRRFAQYSPLQSHMLIHQEKKPHLCEMCGKNFRQKANLQIHIKRHRGVKRHKCMKCEMAFLTKTDYDRHLLKHTGERPHLCQCCRKSFTRSTYLQDHLKRLRGPSAPSCDVCHNKFCDDTSLKKHLKIHEMQHNDNSALIKKEITTINHHNMGRFATLGDPNENMLLLATKATFNNEKHYIIAPVQSITNRESFEEVSDESFQPLVLTSSDESRIPFSTSGHPLFLQGIDLSGQHVSVVASNEMLFTADPNILTAVRELNVPLSLPSEDEDTAGSKTRDEIIEGSDPNMQCAVAKTTEDSIILTQSDVLTTTPKKHLRLSTSGESCQILVPNSNDDTNLMVTMEEESQDTSECDSGLSSNNSAHMNEGMLIGRGSKSRVDAKGQTYIIVDLEF